MGNIHKINFETTERQQKYVAEQESQGGGVGIVFADAFLRGMRDLGYKSTTWAICEQVDNAIQARASTVAIRFGFGNKSKVSPDKLAVIDNGVGMIPKMISYAVRWGGTDRENDRRGFGRYGYGLPSSAVSFCERYTVYSKSRDSDWHAVKVDLKELSSVAGDYSKVEELLTPVPQTPPDWVMGDEGGCEPATFETGTIVVHEKLDRIDWKKGVTIKTKLLQDFGVIYRHWLPSPRILVDGEPVLPVDPLFLMESGRFFDATGVQAKHVASREFDVATSDGGSGKVKIRASYLPPNFQSLDPNESVKKGKKHEGRLSIMSRYNGLLICRDGRQIDCISPRFSRFQNYDRQVRIEIDFDPELDEFFGITTSKQQIVIDEVMWDKLESQGKGDLKRLLTDMRREDREQREKLEARDKAQVGSVEETRPSEVAMLNTEKFKARPDAPSQETAEKAERDLIEAADKVAVETNTPKVEVLHKLKAETESRPFKVVFDTVPEGPFFRPRRLGDQKQLIINTSHPFYAKLYEANPTAKAGLEVLLFSIGEAELESDGELRTFFKSTRKNWSERLRYALDDLVSDEWIADEGSADDERRSEGNAA